MGPRSDERGNSVGRHLGIRGGFASMGPRSDERGNFCWRVFCKNQERASMGPRSDERGNDAPITFRPFAVALQWGRALMSAEIPSAWRPPGLPPELQWGRALMSA